MQSVRLAKVTLNIGVGAAGERLENARLLLEKISGGKAVLTQARTRNPSFKVRKGDNIGAKITLRGKNAEEVLKRLLETVDNKLNPRSFDRNGNVAFGIKEYIEVPGMKYDPKIGMMGFDVCVTLQKPGARISVRKIRQQRLPLCQRVSADEARQFMHLKFGADVSEEEVNE
ncbi:50S ribosomal protein L5 [Candidatus Micrarchaeota archaeon CG1_02_51_15]|nr:MAG: 50S ribosomal protein L5 [Candidatus Micrarchaeota archaeon CG1_02_51_15]